MSDAENGNQKLDAADPVAARPETKVQDATAFSQTVNTAVTASEQAAPEDAEADRSLEVGAKLGKYTIQKKLGQGGMGAVYQAFDPMIEREVAIKVLPPHVARQNKALDRFLSEARATGKLNHPNVVAIYDIAQEGVYYIVMELLRGGSGSEFIANRSAIDWRQAVEIAADACEGLAAAHAAGLIHRDIKPDNLMLTDAGVVKVVDFGLSKLVDATNESRLGLTNAGQVLGTPHFMSPEQFQGKHVDARSDVYSMGATLFSLLTGQPPYAEASNMIHLLTSHVQKPPPDALAVNAELPASCGQVVKKAMAKDPEQRYRDGGEMAVALREVLSAGQDSAQSDRPPTYRPLRSLVVVEPSKVQAMILESTCKKAGAATVTKCTTVADARSRCASETPDLLITAMELSDGNGLQLIGQIREDPSLHDTVLVVNSSDTNIEQLVEVGQFGPLAVVSKKTKPEALLRTLHCCTFLDIDNSPDAVAHDLTTLRWGFVCDGAKVPDPLAALVRQANLMDIQVTTFDALAAGNQFSGTLDVACALRTAGDAARDTWLYTDLISRLQVNAKALAAVQVDGRQLTLRAVQRSGFTAISRCLLDEQRLQRVAQLGQFA